MHENMIYNVGFIFLQAIMIFILLLALVSAAQVTEQATSPSCPRRKHGRILSGNTCEIKCCLNRRVRTMRLDSARSNAQFAFKTCQPFPKRGRRCTDSGYKFRHRRVIKFNNIACYICNNGRNVHYIESETNSNHTVTSYTLVRFG